MSDEIEQDRTDWPTYILEPGDAMMIRRLGQGSSLAEHTARRRTVLDPSKLIRIDDSGRLHYIAGLWEIVVPCPSSW